MVDELPFAYCRMCFFKMKEERGRLFIIHTLFVAPTLVWKKAERNSDMAVAAWRRRDFLLRVKETNERRESFFLAVKRRCDKTYCFLPSFSPYLHMHATMSTESTSQICAVPLQRKNHSILFLFLNQQDLALKCGVISNIKEALPYLLQIL